MLNNKQLLRQTVLSCLLFFCWVMGPAGSSGLAQETPRRPNIVVILVDDLRSDDLACTGNPFVKTPHIDRIAREGMIFRNCFASTPLCSPVRASILTGLYAHKHGIVNNIDRSPQTHRMMTFQRVLHNSGYETGFVGKWHMGLDSTPRPGFDYWVGIPGQGTSFNPVINEQRVAKLTAGHVTDVLNERALQFVKRDREKPFLLYLPHKAVHPELLQREDGSISDPAAANFIPALRHRHLYEDAKIPRRPSYAKTPRGKSALLRKIGDLPPLGADTVTKDEKIRDRLRMLAAIDEGVGQLYDALKRNGQLDNTIFIVTSDHGYFYGEHGLSVERRLAYEDDVLLLNNELIFWIDEIIREVKPDIVISHHPQETVDVHNVCARATYEPFAKQIILVDTPGAASSNLKSFNFTKRPKPLYPFEDTTEPELIVKVSKDVHN